MNSLERAIKRTRRRATADLAIQRAGAGLALGACAGLGLLAVDRLVGVSVPWAAYAATLGGGLVLGVLRAWTERPARLAVAVRLDRALGLKDRIGTAEAIRLGAPAAQEPFSTFARRDAERVAETIDVRAASPVRITRIWALAAGSAAMLVLGNVFVPRAAAERSGPGPAQRAAAQEQRTRIIEAIDRAVAEAERSGADADAQTGDDLEALERLAEQLDGATTPQLAKARDESAARLEEMAERMAEEAQRNLRTLEETTRRFGAISPPEAPDNAPSEAAEFAAALRRGELEEAADRFDEMIDRATGDEHADAIAQELRSFADQIETAAGSDETPDDDKLQRALEDLGLDEDSLDEALRDPDAAPDSEALRRLAEDLERQRQERELDRQADERAREVARALEEAADALEQPDEPPDAPSPGEPSDERNPSQRGADESEQGTPDAPGERDPETTDQGRPTPGEQPDQRGEQGEEQREPGGAEQRRVPGTVPGAPQEGEPLPGQELPTEQQGETQDAAPSESGRRSAARRVSRLLREMERAREAGQDQREVSDRLRRAARELADTLSDEEKEELARRWLGRSRGDSTEGSGSPSVGEPRLLPETRFEDLDLRGEETPDLTINEWLTDEPGADPAVAEQRASAVGRAQRAAEQAVEKSTLPSRYHQLIQRYFGRLPETVEEATTAPAPGGR